MKKQRAEEVGTCNERCHEISQWSSSVAFISEIFRQIQLSVNVKSDLFDTASRFLTHFSIGKIFLVL